MRLPSSAVSRARTATIVGVLNGLAIVDGLVGYVAEKANTPEEN